MIKKIILIIVIVGSGLIFFTNKAKAAESYSYDNLASPNLTGKEYLGNGDYKLTNIVGVDIFYNVYSGIFTFNGVSLGNTFEPILSFSALFDSHSFATYYVSGTVSNNFRFYFREPSFTFMTIRNGENTIRNNLIFNGQSQLVFNPDTTEPITFNNYQFKLQIEQGDTATPYKVPIQALEQHIQLEKEKSYNDGLDDGNIVGYNIEYARVHPEADNTEWFELQFTYKHAGWYSHLGDIAEMVNNDLDDGVGTYEKWIRYYFNSGIETNFLITSSSMSNDQIVIPEPGFIQLYVKVEGGGYRYQVGFFTFGESKIYSYTDNDVVTNSYNYIYKTRLYDEGIGIYDGGYNNGYDDGYFEGKQLYGVGYNEGYNKGVSESIESGGFTMILSSMFTSLGVLLSIELLPNISIGSIVAIPIVFGVIMFIIGRKKE